ncbi:MAG: MoxR family ATPase [Bacteroidetes bacterium]|nr:MoxR family ATPase [Bacteroidota bacterium]MBS1942888.1 MoxR family ATPase [Bacteroidota bacterium]
MEQENIPEGGYAPALPLAELRDAAERIRNGIHRVIIGQDAVIDQLIIALLSDGHVLIEGMPGVAKTLAAKLLARTVDTGFARIQFTPDLMPGDVIGTSIFDPATAAFTFKPGPIFSNIVLVDEINRAPAKTQSALFEVMEERQVTVDGTTHPVGNPFMIVATQNPIEHEGTYRLPEAQLDRFLFKIDMGHPGVDEEEQLLLRAQEGLHRMDAAQVAPVIAPVELARLRQLVFQVKCDAKLVRYIAEIAQATRTDGMLMLGASPRASLAVQRAAKAVAAMQGRDFCVPEDIKQVLPAVLRHRILLTPEREMEGLRPDEAVARIIAKVPVPR